MLWRPSICGILWLAPQLKRVSLGAPRGTMTRILIVTLALGLCGCAQGTSPGQKSSTYDLTEVHVASNPAEGGDVPYVQVAGSDTNWILDGEVSWYSARERYRIVVQGRLSRAGSHTDWQVTDSGAYAPSAWPCPGCAAYVLISDLFDGGAIRFVPDTVSAAATAYVYNNLAGDGNWVYTYRRH